MDVNIPDIKNIPDVPLPDGQAIAEKLNELSIPSGQEVLPSLENLQALPAILMLLCGVVYLLYGWRVFKVLVVINAIFVGGMLGIRLCEHFSRADLWVYGMLVGAVLLGVLSWPLIKIAVSLMGGFVGYVFGGQAYLYVIGLLGRNDLSQYSLIAAIVAGVLLAILSFYIFRFLVVILTSFEGAIFIFWSVFALGLKFDLLAGKIEYQLTHNIHLMPLTVLVIALVGVILQTRLLGKASSSESREQAKKNDG